MIIIIIVTASVQSGAAESLLENGGDLFFYKNSVHIVNIVARLEFILA